jgi:hypothetical protein
MSRISRVPSVGVPSLIGPLFLLLSGFPESSSAPSTPATLRETEVLRIPLGTDPAAISNRECSGRERFCAAGLAFLSPSDTLYFYDFDHENLKVIALHPVARVARLMPGLGSARGGGELPIAGVADGDGSLQVLVATPGSPTRPTLWTLERGSSAWRRAPAVDALAASADLMAPARAASGRLAPHGVTLGRDRAGNSFVEIQKSWSTHVLAQYAPDGRLLAEVTLPERPTWKPLAGWTDKWVTSNGEVLEIQVGPRWLVVSSWKAGV